jgi:hypothetical protein
MKKKVFLSYARADYPSAYHLVEQLTDFEVSGWMDSTDIQAGSAIGSEIRSAIKSSDAMVILVSPDSLRSKWINFELGAGAALDIPIIPIIIGGAGAELDLPPPLQGLDFLDARNRPLDAVAEDVAKALGSLASDRRAALPGT